MKILEISVKDGEILVKHDLDKVKDSELLAVIGLLTTLANSLSKNYVSRKWEKLN